MKILACSVGLTKCSSIHVDSNVWSYGQHEVGRITTQNYVLGAKNLKKFTILKRETKKGIPI